MKPSLDAFCDELTKIANGEEDEYEGRKVLTEGDKGVVRAFLDAQTGKIEDESVHELAEALGLSVDEVESYIYGLAKKAAPDLIPGGLADGKPESKYPESQLDRGQKVEMEHTDDPKKAREIAADHLEEFPDYYTRLAKMEREAEKAHEA